MSRLRSGVLSAASVAEKMPGSWWLAHRMPPRQPLRCVLFHQISDEPSPFTDGLGVRVSTDQFAARLDLLSRRYRFVDLDTVLAGLPQASAARPPLLLTFDDAYAGVLANAAPVCASYGVPSVFFVVGSCVGNRTLGVDNLVAYVVNTVGFQPLERAASRTFSCVSEVIHGHLPSLSLAARKDFEQRVADATGIDPGALAAKARLYVEEGDLAAAPTESRMEVANHTWSHVHCAALTDDELALEIAGNARWLSNVVHRPVRAFSYPYGAWADVSDGAHRAISAAGHTATFFAEARPNLRAGAPHEYDRVTLGPGGDGETFRDMELQPRFRGWQHSRRTDRARWTR